MASRTTLLASLRYRLGEATADVFTDAELKDALDLGIKSLYPDWFQFKVGITTAGAGPVQTGPAGVINIYAIGVQAPTATRVRTIRGWTEGNGGAVVPKVNIEDYKLVWSWTDGWSSPSSDSETLTIPPSAEEAVIIRAHISALERIIAARAKKERYFATQVREGTTEQDVLDAIDALHATLKEHVASTGMKLPTAVR